jgi:hypothetical protein
LLILMILVKMPRIIFKVLNFVNLLFVISMVLTYFCSHPSTKWHIQFCQKKTTLVSDFLIGKAGVALYSGLYDNSCINEIWKHGLDSSYAEQW